MYRHTHNISQFTLLVITVFQAESIEKIDFRRINSFQLTSSIFRSVPLAIRRRNSRSRI